MAAPRAASITRFGLMLYNLPKSMLELVLKSSLVVIAMLAAVLLFTPYEAFLEGFIAVGIVVAVVFGFLMVPRREVFHVRTTVRLTRPDRNYALEHDLVAVRAEVARLWLLFVPTFLAVAFLVFFAAGGPTKFSFLNWILTSRIALIAFIFGLYPCAFVLLLLRAWIGERRVMRDAEACAARSFTFSNSDVGRIRIARVSYLFMGEHGEYYGGDRLYFGLVKHDELAGIVFHNVRKPELNMIAMVFLFHRLTILGRGVTDLDKQTVAAQRTLAEIASPS